MTHNPAADSDTAGTDSGHTGADSGEPSQSTAPPPLKCFKFLAKKLTVPAAAAAEAAVPTVDVQLANYLADVQSGSIRATEQSDKPGFQALYYWQRIQSTYPSVAPLALDVLSMPASEAYAERVFSVCGYLSAGKRNRLSKNIERRVFIKMNSKVLNDL